MSLDPSAIKIGPGRIYLDVTAPASGDPLGLTSGAPTTGTEVGLTEGEALFTYEIEYVEEVADQVLPAVAVFASLQAATLEFSMKEYAAYQLQAAMQNVDLTVDNVASPKYDLLSFGGADYEVTTRTVVLVSPRPNTSPQRYTLVMLYAAYQSEPFKARYTKDGSTVFKTTFKGIADTARNDKDMLGQITLYRN